MKLKLTSPNPIETCGTVAFEIAKICYRALNKAEYDDCVQTNNDFSFLKSQGYTYGDSRGIYYTLTENTNHKKANCGRMELTSFSATKSSHNLAIMALLCKLGAEGGDYAVFQLDAVEGDGNMDFSLFYQECAEAFNKLKLILARLREIEMVELDVEL
jgi:hypothetical protein